MEGSISHATYRKGLGHSSVVAVCSAVRGILISLPAIFIAKNIGLGNATDAYLMAVSINLIILKFVRVGTLPKIFIMVLSEKFVRDRKSVEDDISNFFNILLIVSSLVMLAAYFLAPFLIKVIAIGFANDKKLLTIQIFRLIIPLFFYQSVMSLFESIFNLFNKFGQWAISNLISPLIAFCFVYFFVAKLGIFSIVYGTLLGAFTHLCVLGFYIIFNLNYSYRFRLNFKDRLVKEIPVLLYPYYFSSFFVQVMEAVQSFFASMLAPGLASVYFFAMRMKDYVEIFAIDSLLQFSFVYFIKEKARYSIQQLKKVYTQLLNMINYVSVPALILLAANGVWLCDIFFGSKFSDPGIITTLGLAFSWCAIFLLPEASNNIQFAVILAMKNTLRPNIINILRMVVVILLTIILFKRFKFWGIIFANSLTHLQGFLMNHWYLRKKYGFENIFMNPAFLKTVLLNLFLAFFSVSLNYTMQRYFSIIYLHQKILAAGASLCIGALFYLSLSYLFKSKELHTAFAVLRKREI